MTPKRVLMLLYRNLEAALHDHRVLKEAKALAREGFNVDILVFGQEKKTHVTDEGVELHQVVEVRRNKLRQRTARARIVKQFFSQNRYAVVHCHDFLMLETAVWAGLHRRAPLIYDSHEYFIGSMGMAGRSALLRKAIQWLERFYTRRVKAVITVGGSIARILERDLSQDKVYVVRNTPDWKPFEGETSEYAPPGTANDSPVKLVYHGLIGRARGVDVLVEMMRLLPDRFHLAFFGLCTDDIKRYFAEFGERVSFHGLLPLLQLREELHRCHIGVYPIQDACLSYHYTSPNKLFEAIHCQLPVVISDLPEISGVVKKFDIGAVARADDANEFAEAILDAVENNKLERWRKNCLHAAEEYRWERDARELLSIYRKILN